VIEHLSGARTREAVSGPLSGALADGTADGRLARLFSPVSRDP
jgi:hypothetical protein